MRMRIPACLSPLTRCNELAPSLYCPSRWVPRCSATGENDPNTIQWFAQHQSRRPRLRDPEPVQKLHRDIGAGSRGATDSVPRTGSLFARPRTLSAGNATWWGHWRLRSDLVISPLRRVMVAPPYAVAGPRSGSEGHYAPHRLALIGREITFATANVFAIS
jgi:hypothetical protein